MKFLSHTRLWWFRGSSPSHLMSKMQHRARLLGHCVYAFPPSRGPPVRILAPNRVRKLLGLWSGAEGGGRVVGRPVSRRGPGGGEGSVGTPTYKPQNDPHDALIIWNIHSPNCGKDWGFQAQTPPVLYCLYAKAQPFLLLP